MRIDRRRLSQPLQASALIARQILQTLLVQYEVHVVRLLIAPKHIGRCDLVFRVEGEIAIGFADIVDPHSGRYNRIQDSCKWFKGLLGDECRVQKTVPEPGARDRYECYARGL